MKIGAVVAEFNPFHNGHAALISAARARGVGCVVAVMSGSFVQRGEAAIADKFVRTRCALAGGVDIVLELPLPWATATAQRFAAAAVTILQATGIVDTLIFGSESGDSEALGLLAAQLDSPSISQAMAKFLADGLTFAKARQLAAEQILGKGLSDLLATPNNALAVEYLRAANRMHWAPELLTIPRQGAEHDADSPKAHIASASYLRKRAVDFTVLGRYMPSPSVQILQAAAKSGTYPADWGALDTAILAHLRRLPKHSLAGLPDLSEGLENRLYTAIRAATTLEELHALLKTKRYTLARVRRLVLAAFLGVTLADLDMSPPYIRVLGYRRESVAVLGQMGRSASLAVNASLAPLGRLGPNAKRLAELEAQAGDLFALTLPAPYPCGAEFKAKVELL